MRTALIIATKSWATKYCATMRGAFNGAPSERPGVATGPFIIPNPRAGGSELRGELLQAHDLHQLAHFVLLLLAEHHDQRDGGAPELLHLGAIGVDRGELAA